MNNQKKLNDKNTDDSASIYQRQDIKTEKQKLKEMTFRQKITYFNNYYTLKVIVILAVLAFVIYTAYSIATPDPKTVLYAAVINNAIDPETALKLQSDFGTHLNINEKKENIMIDTSFYIGSEEDYNEYTLASQQKLTTYLVAAQIDVIIAPESAFTHYAYYGNLSKLSDQLPTDLCSSLADSFFNTETEQDSSKSAYGIYLDNATIYDKNGDIIDKPVLGIAVNTKQNQNVVEFIRYLFQLY